MHRWRGRAGSGLCPETRVRARPSPVRRRRRWVSRVRRRRHARSLHSVTPDVEHVVGLGPAPAPSRRECGIRPSPRQTGRVGHGPGMEPIRNRVPGWRTPCRRGSRGRISTRPMWDPGETWSTTVGGVLQALSFAPTGAICAAATTSLPEVGGGHPELGLPLRLGSGRLLYDPGPVGSGLPRRGQ